MPVKVDKIEPTTIPAKLEPFLIGIYRNKVMRCFVNKFGLKLATPVLAVLAVLDTKEPILHRNFKVEKLLYSEIMHSDWLKLFT